MPTEDHHRGRSSGWVRWLIPPNPLRSEADAFRFLMWFVAVVVVILVIVLIVQSG